MACSQHELVIQAPIEEVWALFSDMNRWAPLITGYKNHRIVNEQQSTWTFKGEVGKVKKTIHIKLFIKEWKKPHQIAFEFSNDKLKGNGHFKATNKQNETIILTYLQIAGKGMLGPIINPILKSLLPKTLKDLTEAIAKEVTKRQPVQATT